MPLICPNHYSRQIVDALGYIVEFTWNWKQSSHRFAQLQTEYDKKAAERQMQMYLDLPYLDEVYDDALDLWQ